ncbi:MAG: 30S ribosome-binding factor RbfA [Rikenellaceae bacterium]
METTRQQKVSKQIQKDIAEILQRDLAELLKGILTTVTIVRISPDLSYAKIYISIFPFDKNEAVLQLLKDNNWRIRKALGSRTKNQLRIVPELEFFLDDSLEYIEGIDKALK